MTSQELIDAEIRNQIALRKYIKGRTSKILALFEKYDRALAGLLRTNLRKGLIANSATFKKLLQDIQELRKKLFYEASLYVTQTQLSLLPVEHKKEWALLLLFLGLKEEDEPGEARLSNINKIPFASGASSAATLSQWLSDLQTADYRRIRDALILAVNQQDTADDTLERIIGKKRDDFRTGVVSRTRHNIQALLATALAHLSQNARESLWVEVEGVTGMVWVAILDSRTTDICISRDNKVVMFGGRPLPPNASPLQPSGARPPAHPHCRSMMVPLIGDTLPARRTFAEFFTSQSVSTQNKILGIRKAELFRKGKVELDGFVDETGEEYTLKQLERNNR